MKKHLLFLIVALSALALFSAFTFPDEGEWLLTQIPKLHLEKFRKAGLQLTPKQIYTPNEVSLTSAVVLLPGGTGSFVSNDGLIITNHHIAFGGIQALSSVQDDYLKNGFAAAKHDDELSCPTYFAQVVTNIQDVTSAVLSAVNDTMSAESRTKAIQKKVSEIQDSLKAKSDTLSTDFQISEMYNGLQYLLFTFDVLRDIRLVYAPPGDIGVYGGETDNWMWPRHTGDFAFLRAYVSPDGKHVKYAKENVPYHPKKFLPMSTHPLKEGSFAMIMGFPGRTYRYRTASEIKLAKEETLPMTIDWYKKRMDIIDAAGAKDRAVEIQYASKVRGIANTEKNYVGTLEGMQRSDLIKLREDDEAAFHKYIDTKEELESKYESTLSDIAAAQLDLKSFNKKQFYLGQFAFSIDMLRLASAFNTYADSFKKDSTGAMKPSGRSPLMMVTSLFKDMSISVDKAELVALLETAADLPSTQEIAAVKEVAGDKTGDAREKAIRDFVDSLYASTKLGTPDGAKQLIDALPEVIKADPFVQFAAKINADRTALQPRTTKYNAEITRLRAEWVKARMAWKGNDLYPDANRSIRFTYGTVKSYDPRDAVHYDYMTSLTGVIQKETGEGDFIVPQKLHQLWEKKDFGKYTDPRIKDIPVAFTANLDITGGNSGSPVINGKGELIGVAFDGNWEAVVGDYYFQEPLNRTISVDTRYVLFILDKFSNAQNILKELVVH